MEPRCSAWVNLFRQKSKEMVEPSAIAGRSREMSQKGSIVVDTPLHTCMSEGLQCYIAVAICHMNYVFLQNLTDNIWLKFPSEYCVNNAGAGRRDNACSRMPVFDGFTAVFTCLVYEMSVQEIQGGNEELMSILMHTSCHKSWYWRETPHHEPNLNILLVWNHRVLMIRSLR